MVLTDLPLTGKVGEVDGQVKGKSGQGEALRKKETGALLCNVCLDLGWNQVFNQSWGNRLTS